jgi:hypothetical protein
VTVRRSLAVVLLVTALSGCTPFGEQRPQPTAPPPPSGDALPALPTNASIGLPAYQGAPSGGPSSLGPLTRVRARVDLTPATPGVFARTVAVTPAADGGAYVLLNPIEQELPLRLVTVGPDQAIGPVVETSDFLDVWDMHELPDGRVAIGGLLSPEQGYGVVLVDPATGVSRTVQVASYAAGSLAGGTALSDGTLYVFVSNGAPTGESEQLVAIDPRSATVRARHALSEDVAAASQDAVAEQFGGLLPRPGGGVTLVFDASPTRVPEDRIPTLLSFDASLRLTAEPVRVTDLAEGAETQAATVTPDGTVFLLVEVREGGWIVAVPDGGGAGPVLAQLADRVFDYALEVEPAQHWALVPAAGGAQAVDLTTGSLGGTLDLGCEPKLDVRDIVPAAGGALLVGECDTPREDTQMLWFAGP